MGNRKKKFRKEKRHLIFDPDERKDYLTGNVIYDFIKLNYHFINIRFIKIVFTGSILGFRKRKAERRLKAKEKLEKMLREEKKNIKLRQKDQLKKLYEQQRDVPEVSHLIEDEQDKPTMTFELPNQFVNITMFDANQMAGQLGYMGLNGTENSQEESEQVQKQPDEGEDEDEDEDEEESDDLINRITKTKKLVKKQTLNDLKKSKAFQVKQKQKHSNDLKKSKLFRKKLKREMKNSKLKSRTSKSKKRKDKRKKIK